MVQSMKRCVKETTGKAKVTHDELSTASKEVEAIPWFKTTLLLYISSDDLEEPLTLSHMLTRHHILSLPNGTLEVRI